MTFSMFPDYTEGELLNLQRLIRDGLVVLDRKSQMLSGDVTGHYLTPSTWRHKDPRVRLMRDSSPIKPRRQKR